MLYERQKPAFQSSPLTPTPQSGDVLWPHPLSVFSSVRQTLLVLDYFTRCTQGFPVPLHH
jgi:hypothetical protein